jgi:uncharacterized protein
MKISLKAKEKESGIQKVTLDLTARLPAHISKVNPVVCEYEVTAQDNYYLVRMKVNGELELLCQRCLQNFSYPYQSEMEIAVCESDSMAEKLLERFETIVERSFIIDLEEIVTDELYLSVPERHVNEEDCDKEVSKYIG